MRTSVVTQLVTEKFTVKLFMLTLKPIHAYVSQCPFALLLTLFCCNSLFISYYYNRMPTYQITLTAFWARSLKLTGFISGLLTVVTHFELIYTMKISGHSTYTCIKLN